MRAYNNPDPVVYEQERYSYGYSEEEWAQWRDGENETARIYGTFGKGQNKFELEDELEAIVAPETAVAKAPSEKQNDTKAEAKKRNAPTQYYVGTPAAAKLRTVGLFNAAVRGTRTPRRGSATSASTTRASAFGATETEHKNNGGISKFMAKMFMESPIASAIVV